MSAQSERTWQGQSYAVVACFRNPEMAAEEQESDQTFRVPMAWPFTYRVVSHGIDTATITVKMFGIALSQKPDARRDDCENSKRQQGSIGNDANDQLTPRQ
ncbi:hypothetical protein [Bradyrhizobium sp.]|uniref:hypothetical protein n=1 Tax=Bradyrhizobium sp. TaxID=376 RepID=UPI003C3F9F0E